VIAKRKHRVTFPDQPCRKQNQLRLLRNRLVHSYANTANVALPGDDLKTGYFCTRVSAA
jgi:hypothetical protein